MLLIVQRLIRKLRYHMRLHEFSVDATKLTGGDNGHNIDIVACQAILRHASMATLNFEGRRRDVP